MTAGHAAAPRGRVFDVQRWSLHDGPGVRTIVFLKGCPLRCEWCSNPESQAPYPELAFFADKCIACHRCVGLCEHGAITVGPDGQPRTDWSICQQACYGTNVDTFACTAKCYGGARSAIGSLMSVTEVMDQVMKDALMYRESGGGMTLSGGEPMNQFQFVLALLREAKSNYLHTAMETCGFATWTSYQQVLEYVDFLFLDLKHYDSAWHRSITGQGNEEILSNAPRLAEAMRQKGGQLVVRIPIIPGMTDQPDNVTWIADFVAEKMPGVETLELMPYHRLGRGKYGDIGKVYRMDATEPPMESAMAPLRSIVAARGLSLAY